MKIITKIKKFFGFLDKADKERLELKRVSQVFGILERCRRAGLLSWQERERRLFITEPLAQVQLRSRETWNAFMENVMLWCLYNRQQEAWEKLRINREAKAVREAKAKVCILTKAERERVRRAARNSMGEGDIAAPKPEAFEIFIVNDSLTPSLPRREGNVSANSKGNQRHSPSDGEGSGVKVLAVGSYNPETERTDMAMWDTVKDRLRP